MKKKQKHFTRIVVSLGFLFLTTNIFSQDPNFHIYLCFGQSNMEGYGTIEGQDTIVDDRFQVMEALDCPVLGRTKGSWYTAKPPLCRCNTKLSPVDYFGKTMIANLPDSIKVGVVHVAVGGCKIELFDKNNYQAYVNTITSPTFLARINEYDNGNPYAHFVEIAQLAQQDGVIKGILMHQGEANNGDSQWPLKVKDVYDTLLTDLNLDPNSVPLLAGEVVHTDQGGVCGSMNTIIATLPTYITNSYIIPSSGCQDGADNLHFGSAGYRELGRRYAVKMLTLLGHKETLGLESKSIYFEPECATIGDDWNLISDEGASNEGYVTVKPGLSSPTAAATDSASAIYFTFSIDTAGTFGLLARVNHINDAADSYYAKMDDGEFVKCNDLLTNGWQWLSLNNYYLTSGEHTLTITYREGGAKLDKICLTNYTSAPTGMGEEAENICEFEADSVNTVTSLYFEPECAIIGSDWDILSDDEASNGSYVSVKPGTESTSAAATDSASAIFFTFSVNTVGTFNLYARLNCPSGDDDSFWIKMDNGAFVKFNDLANSGWQWTSLTNYNLTPGEHTLTITYREDGAKLDKIFISNSSAPIGLGEKDENCGTTTVIAVKESLSGYVLNQNYPNPFSNKTNISFEIPNASYVSLKVFNMQGIEITELAGKQLNSGKHIIEFDASKLSKGNYFYMIKTDSFSATKKMIILSE